MEKKEAMKILKDFHDKSALFSVRTALDTVIPELKESEDERIKKEIIEMLRNLASAHYMTREQFSERMAWLGKQGEPSDKTHYWTEEEIEPIISDYLRGAEHYGGMIARLRCLKPKPLELPKQEWSKEDKARIKQLLGWIDTLKNYIHYDSVVPADLRIERIDKVVKLESWLKSIIEP